MTVQTASADITRETVAAISPGDAVEFGDERYEWASALDVVDATEPVEWDVRYGEDWWTRTIIIEGVRGGQYGVVAADHGPDDFRVESYDVEDGELADKRGTVVCLTLADETDEDEGGTDGEDDHAVGDELPDDLDGEEDDTSEPEVVLPDGLTTEDVEDAVESNKDGGRAYLTDVADELDISRGKARTLTVRLDLYSNVSESTRGDR